MIFLDGMFILGNIILCFGTIILIRAVWKNRDSLKGYSGVGAFLTLLPLLIFSICYVIMGNWIALIFASVTVLYWALVFLFKAGPSLTRCCKRRNAK